MTRREEIEKAANEFYKGDEVSTFVVAAQWADRTMIQRLENWLKDNFRTSWVLDCYGCFTNETEVTTSFDTMEELMESFHKAMEE